MFDKIFRSRKTDSSSSEFLSQVLQKDSSRTDSSCSEFLPPNFSRKMVHSLLRSQVSRAYRQRRLRRPVHSPGLNSGKLTKLNRIVKKREVTQRLERLTQMAIDSAANAITMAQQNRYYRRILDASALAIALPFSTGTLRRFQRKIRELEASLYRLKDKYQGYRVKINDTNQMTAMEYLHSIGWRGTMSTSRENRDIAGRIDALQSAPNLRS